VIAEEQLATAGRLTIAVNRLAVAVEYPQEQLEISETAQALLSTYLEVAAGNSSIEEAPGGDVTAALLAAEMVSAAAERAILRRAGSGAASGG